MTRETAIKLYIDIDTQHVWHTLTCLSEHRGHCIDFALQRHSRCNA